MPADRLLERLEQATAGLQAPFALVDLDALDRNAADMVRRAGGLPIRLASKSVRCRTIQRRVLDRPGYAGTLCFTLPEALWLAECGFEDLLVGYPTTDREALAALAARNERHPKPRIALMVDCIDHLDLIENAAGPGDHPLSVCIDIDAGWWPARGAIKIGAKRSPIRSPQGAAAVAREVLGRPRLDLVGLMGYESQIAGVGDRPPGRPLMGRVLRLVQRGSAGELARRRRAVVEAVRAVHPALEIVNGGGTGSLERSAAEGSLTELAAGSGLFAPTLFDAYGAFDPAPAAMFALPIVRRPSAAVATALGGGYLASGAGGADRLPTPFLPRGLRLDAREGAGEVQTPLSGAAAATLAIGDRVWMRHAKAGELCERFNTLHLLDGDEIVDEVPTYRGEGHCFL